jgi:NADP-dependent 3-hydroxy acid dehydrogenase YdfG
VTRVVLVPDADTAAGAELARASAAAGDVVVLCGTDQTRLGAVAAELDVRTALFVGDLRDEADRAALHEMIEELFAPR